MSNTIEIQLKYKLIAFILKQGTRFFVFIWYFGIIMYQLNNTNDGGLIQFFLALISHLV